jgi:hypothetical protein
MLWRGLSNLKKRGGEKMPRYKIVIELPSKVNETTASMIAEMLGNQLKGMWPDVKVYYEEVIEDD